jgi:hypothetical protein
MNQIQRQMWVGMRVASFACAWGLLTVGQGAGPLAQAESTAPASAASDAAPLEFRRVFVPAERVEEWPADGARYLPIEREEFFRLVNQAEQRRQIERVGSAQIISASFSAILSRDDLLEGSAVLSVRQIDDEPSIVPLDPWNAVILRGEWIADSTDDARAVLGLWHSAVGSTSQYGLLADRSGDVEIRWQQAPQRSDDVVEFDLHMPTAVSRRLTLELPAGAVPTVVGARLTDQSPAERGGRRWAFQLSAGGEHRLLIRRPRSLDLGETNPLPLAAISEAYRLSADGIDYEMELRLRHRAAPNGELRLKVPPTLHIAEALVDRQAVVWRRDPDDADGLIIPLPSADPERHGTQLLTTLAIRGAATAAFDVPWKLPTIVPEGVFWTEGTSTLWIDPALELRSIEPKECSLLNVVGVGSDAGEVYRLQAWSSAASAELVVGERMPKLHYRAGIAIEIADREIVAKENAVLWSEGGRAFHVAAPLGDQWQIEAITASPAEDLLEWHVEEGEARRLHLQLRRSPTASMPLTIAVSARKPWRAWTRRTALGELELLQLPGYAEGRWLAATHRRGEELIPDSRLAEAIVPQADVPLAAQSLLGESAKDPLIDLGVANRNGFLSVSSTPVAYSGEAWMELTPLAIGYEHRAEILCRPATGAVNELRVLAARELPSNVIWELSDGSPVAAEYLGPLIAATDAGEFGRASGAAETTQRPVEYRLRFNSSFAAPFRIRAMWRSSSPKDAAVNPLSLPDALSWQSWATFRGHPERIAVDSQLAVAAALPPPTSADDLPAIACFRLGDDPTSMPAELPSFAPAAGGDSGKGGVGSTSSAFAWRLDATTEQLADGTQKLRLDYQVETREPTEVQLSFATSPVSVTSITLEDRSLAATSPAPGRTVRFRLPAAAGRQKLTVIAERKVSPLNRGAAIQPDLPQTSFPVLRGNWTLLWPIAYDGRPEDVRSGHSAQASTDGWAARLFGPLSRDSRDQWYDGMLLAHVEAPSSRGASTEHGVVTPGGWSSLTQPFVDQPGPVELRLASGEQAKWHVAWLIAAVVGSWLWARTRRLSALLIASVAVACLVLPERFVPAPQAIFLGLATGAAVRQIVSFLTKSRAARFDRSDSTIVARSAASASLALFALAPLLAQAQSLGTPLVAANEPRSAAAESTPVVLFPVDGDGKPTGGDVYVPAPMAAKLFPPSVARSAALVDARYQVELQPVDVTGELTARAVHVRLIWQSQQRQTLVEMPFSAADGSIDASTFQLNGVPVKGSWNNEGTSISVELPNPGRHELTFSITPLPHAVASVGDRGRLHLHVPRLAGSTVEVIHPTGLKGLQAAKGTPRADQASATRTVFRLSATPLLDLAWPAEPPEDRAGVAIEQLSLLEVDPSAARLNVRLRLSGTGKPLTSLRAAISPQLKLLPLPEGSPVEVVETGSSGPDVDFVDLRFRGQSSYPMQLALQFELQRSLSVGRIDFPWVDFPGMNVRIRHFAVAADDSLLVKDSVAAGVTPVAPAELEPVWGAIASGAALRYAVAVPRPGWALDVARRAQRFTSRESLQLHCGDDGIQFLYSAAISEIEGQLLLHRLDVPPDLQIAKVTAVVDGASDEVPIRWSRPAPGKMEVFLGRPLGDSHSIRIEGTVAEAITALPAGAAADAGWAPAIERHVQVPRIGLEAAASTPIDLLVLRSSNILVDWSASAPAAKPLGGAFDPERGLVVGHYQASRGDAPAPELRITPNVAAYDADALLTLQPDAVEPIGECRLVGKVTQGVVDRLRLVVGKTWRGPFNCDPPAQVVRLPLASDVSRQILEIRMAKPIAAGESFDLSLRGAVALEEGQRLRFPTMELSSADRQRVFLMLPPTASNLTAEWTLRGLAAEPLPEHLARVLKAERPPIAYRVARDRFVAEQRIFPDAMRRASYRLAESRIGYAADGSAVALVQLIVQLGGGERCRVSFPAGAELQYASVDGALQPRPSGGKQEWEAPAGSRFLPRVLLFCYRLPRVDDNSIRVLEPPWVSIDGNKLDPESSLWHVTDVGGFGHFESREKRITESQFAAAARRAQIEAFLDAYPLASQLAEWELQSWRQPWLDRLDDGSAVMPDDPVAWKRLRDRIGPAQVNRTAPADAVREWSREGGDAGCFVGDVRGRVTLTPKSLPWPIGRWASALTLTAAIVIAWRQPKALKNLALPAQRWPYTAAATVGCLWWLLLAPSTFGLLLIAFALAAYWKSRT